MSKFIAALARHELARQTVDALSHRIGGAISRCPIVKRSEDWNLPNEERAAIWDDNKGRVKSHLWQVYNSLAVFGEEFDEEGQEDALQPCNDGCRHCLRAFRLIRKRKAIRKELGYAKLSLRALGRQAIKLMAEETA